MNQHSIIPFCSVEELYRMYCVMRMTQQEIADSFGVGLHKVQGDMRRAGIRTRIAAKRNQAGPANHRWKGNGAGYKALHLRISAVRGKPLKCEECGIENAPTGYEWANLTGKYEDINDYRRLCKSCHRLFDHESMRHPVKLTASAVRYIKSQLQKGNRVAELADQFNVCQAMIYAIRSGKAWSHVA